MRSAKLICGLTLLVAVAVWAGCPNACSGNGLCGQDDMCSCSRNFQGADCSLRTCPAATSHTTTGRGDMNLDGDTLDNSLKRVPSVSGTVALVYLSDMITLSAATSAAYTELTLGDGILLNGQKHTLSAKTSDTVWQLDSVFMGPSDGTGLAFKFVQTIQNPQGDWEGWVGDFVAANDEGHFYMECANRGICDRKAGACKCFPGYAGAACERTVCPNDCSGHGTCDFVSELAVEQPSLVACEVHAGVQGAHTFTTKQDCTTLIAAGDKIWIGEFSKPLTVLSRTATVVTLAAVTTNLLPEDVAPGAIIRVQRSYGLWDANINRACKCDARYEGYDCSARKCPHGDDPLTVGQQSEVQIIHLGGMNPRDKVLGYFKLTFEDMFGEKWTTGGIAVDGAVDKSPFLAAALKALPNDVVQGVTVTHLGVSDTTPTAKGSRYHVKFNGGAVTTNTGNSGDLPTMACDNSALRSRLLGASVTGYTYSAANGQHILTKSGGVDAGAVAVGDVIAVSTSSALVADATVTGVTATTITIDRATASGDRFQAVRNIPGASCTVSDVAQMMPATSAGVYVTATVVSGTKTVTLSAAVHANDLSVGDKLRLWTSATVNQVVTVTNIATAVISTKEALTAAYSSGSYVERYGRGTTEKSVCSGRGMCDGASGVCKCFKGYTFDDCSKQSALAA